MNIFVVDTDPVIAAQSLCNSHVVKMIVESAQMLSTAHRMLDGKLTRRPSKSGKTLSKYWVLDDKRENVLYKAVHMGHPCTVWTTQSNNNYNWHYCHFIALCEEYRHRYGKTHATETKLAGILSTPPKNIPIGTLTSQPLAMGSNPECINKSDIVESYRNFYQTKQTRFKMVWTKREIPEWFVVK
jgi:hypothetical protein